MDGLGGDVTGPLVAGPGLVVDPVAVGLSRGALALRTAHAALAVVELTGLGYLWACALRRRRGRLLTTAVGLLAAEGAALVVGRGNCPLGPLQERCGDPTPLFQLVLPPRPAKAAVPVLAAVAVGGMITLVVRRPPA